MHHIIPQSGLRVCDVRKIIPLLFLCDTPGIMVGPEIKKAALVRHSSCMFIVGATLLKSLRPAPRPAGKQRPAIDAWQGWRPVSSRARAAPRG